MSFIPQSFIEELLARIDIVDVINARVPLRKTGRNYSACCPFHHEKTPSFNVVPDKQFYHCFGCQAAGSAIKFVMSFDQLDFKEAIEKLAAELGLEIPQDSNNDFNNRYQEYFDILEQTSKYYEKNLTAGIAQNYLHKRGIDVDFAKFFKIGFSPDGWNNLTKIFNHYQIKDSTLKLENLLEQVGLWLKKTDENATPNHHTTHGYDRFRNRLMFPIRDIRGRVIGFGGRVLDDSKPKYLNSPETVLFHKSSELYGLYESLKKSQQHKNKINKFVIVEGYLDVVALFQHGIDYTVATLGTATSYRHLAKLFKYANEVIYCFDGDEAGRTAAWRALENSLSALYDGRVIKFLFLPDNHDPDSYVREFGKNNFEDLLSKSISLTDFLFLHEEANLGENNLSTVEGRVNLLKLVKPHINKVPEGAYRTILETELAKRCQLNVANLDKILHDNKLDAGASRSHTNLPIHNESRLHERSTVNYQKPSLWRRACLLLLHNPNFLEIITKHQAVIEHIANTKGTKGEVLFYKIYQLLRKTSTIPELLDGLADQEAANVKKVILQLLDTDPMINSAAAQQEFEDLLIKIKKEHVLSEMDILKTKIANQGMASLSAQEKERLQALLMG